MICAVRISDSVRFVSSFDFLCKIVVELKPFLHSDVSATAAAATAMIDSATDRRYASRRQQHLHEEKGSGKFAMKVPSPFQLFLLFAPLARKDRRENGKNRNLSNQSEAEVQSKLEVTHWDCHKPLGAGTNKYNQTARTWHEQAKQLLFHDGREDDDDE